MEKKDTRFKPGNPGKKKGTLNEKTKFWNELKDFVTSEGAQRFRDELNKLEGKEYIKAYAMILEFFAPKLQKIDAKVSENKSVTIVEDK